MTPGRSTRSQPTKRLHRRGEPMAMSVQQKPERSPEEVARLRELRERFQREKPSIADLEAQGVEFATLGEVILLRCLADELRQERERQGVTQEQLAERLHMNSATLAGIEAGTVGKLTLGTLSRIAHALGKRIACSLVEKVA
jgi:DNA-binding XRE family transcriptional regulator